MWAMGPGAPGPSAAQALQFCPSAPADPAMTGKLQSHQFIDPQTGQVIPTETIMKNLGRLDELTARLEVGSKVYHDTKKKAKVTPEQKQRIAKKKGNEAQGGRRTDLWDEAHDDQVVMSMCVTGPPAYDADEARKELIYCHVWT